MATLDKTTSVFDADAEAGGGKAQDAVRVSLEDLLATGIENHGDGSVVPKQDCPHVKDHVKIGLDQLPVHPQTARCTYAVDAKRTEIVPNGNSNNEQRKGQPKLDSDNEEDNSCPLGENWLCLECGAVGCSRHMNGHGLSHWKESRKRRDSTAEGHCVAASLADLSVWCYECESYVQSPLLNPFLEKLDQLRVQGESEPKKKKARQSRPNCGQVQPPGFGQSSGDETSNNNTDDNDNGDDDDEDDEDNGSDSDNSATIIDIATAVARGIPLALLTENDDHVLEYPFESLPRSLSEVSNFIQSEKCRSIVILAGAGMSVSAGIPDFRSANGLYATMNPDLLSADPVEREAIRVDPTVALEHGMFLQNPLPCLELNREFILGTRNQKWKATLAHRFVELLHAKTGKLARLYTQNIDGLEDQCTQLPRDKVIAVHGSMDRAECAHCGQEYDYNQFCDRVRDQIKDLSGKDKQAPQESTPITCRACGYHSVKPAIVLFRSSLPMTFFENVPRDVSDVDLLIIIGTSLRVAPANSLVWRVPKTSMRLLVNREPVGWHLGMVYGPDSKRDVFAQGNCDHVLLDLMAHLGWLKDLEPFLKDHKLPESSAALLRSRLGKDASDGVYSNENSDG